MSGRSGRSVQTRPDQPGQPGQPDPRSEPLAGIGSIKVKLGLLVGISVLVATVLATAAASSVSPWLSIPVVVAIALAVTQLIAAGMTQPLREMTRAADRMAGGDYATRVTATAGDEVGRLARAFNTMSHDLATVDRQRRELVATVSHEIRTPLAALTAQLENLADGVSPATPPALEGVLDQATRLGDLVQDLLDLSRVDGGAESLRPESLRLAELVDGAVAEVRGLRGDIAVEVRIDPALQVYADRARVRQGLVNLVDNATRHAESRVTVTAGAGAIGWSLDVYDDGPGVDPAARERIFERFGTADPQTGGTGLGLAVARWIATLHGGRLDLLPPDLTPERGAGFRLTVPHDLSQQEKPPMPTPHPAPHSAHHPLSTQPHPVSARPSAPMVEPDLIRVWPENGIPTQVRTLLACLGVGVLAGVIVPIDSWGIGWSLIFLVAGGVVLAGAKHRRDRFTLACAGLCASLALVPTFRTAGWLVGLCALVGAALMTIGLVRGRTVPAFILSGLAWPGSGLRGLPLLGRTLRAASGHSQAPTIVRTVLFSVLAFGVFGLLFSAADALFGTWFDTVMPNVEAGEWIGRIFLGIMIGGSTLAAAYLALNPPPVDRAVRQPIPLRSRYEWLVPVLVVDSVFVAFLIAQSRATLGGHDYIEQAAGISYADYVHSGFTEMNVATLLSLLVLWIGSRRASRERRADRFWLRGSLGLLCLCTLAVIGSSIWRMTQYVDAYGLTRMRYLVYFFEGWLALVFVLVLGFGAARLRISWLPRAAVLTGAAAVLVMAGTNPDASIAERNLTVAGKVGVDVSYLSGLSADATPTILAHRPDLAGCLDLPDSGRWHWSLGAERARHAFGEVDRPVPVSCPSR